MFYTSRSFTAIILLYFVYSVRPVPTSLNNTLNTRADDDVPPEFQPVLQDDGLPFGEPEDALQDYDFKFDLEELKECPDFDAHQEDGGEDQEDDNTKDLVKKDNSIKNVLQKRVPRSGTTKILRAVSINGAVLPQLLELQWN
ncbi:MAG: hypothetical protein Q9186_005062 [Xanthomendoza sp. 1 TL-2023]